MHFVAPTDIFYNFFIPSPTILEHLYQVTENDTISPEAQTTLAISFNGVTDMMCKKAAQ